MHNTTLYQVWNLNLNMFFVAWESVLSTTNLTLSNALVAFEIGDGQSYSIDPLVLPTRLVTFYY